MQTNGQPPVWTGGEVVFAVGERGTLWRVLEGAVRLDRGSGQHAQCVQVAFVGDLLGVEALCDRPYQWTARALVPCRLEAVHTEHTLERDWLMRQSLLQQLQRSQDMAALRTGAVSWRLTQLLHMLGHDCRGTGDGLAATAAIRRALPPLKDLAQLVDAKSETVCRALATLLPRDRSSAPPRHRAGWARPALAANIGPEGGA